MDYDIWDCNGASAYFDQGPGTPEWQSLARILEAMPLYLQASDQRNKVGVPIFDPKATNAHIERDIQADGWHKPVVPEGLQMFGVDWDGGRNATLAEWQFSNYPFLWNNVIRTEAVMRGKIRLPSLEPIAGLIEVTKCGAFPASNSALYFEQGRAQLETVMAFNIFRLPIRLVGLRLPTGTHQTPCVWTTYEARYNRVGVSRNCTVQVSTGQRGKLSFKLT